jgi:hypothetical protein
MIKGVGKLSMVVHTYESQLLRKEA